MEIYRSSTGVEVTILLENETLWATQRQIADIFDTTPQNITQHLKRVFKDGEIEESSTCKEYLQVQTEGQRKVHRNQLLYNLDAILSVGYRINSKRGTQFRQWATQRLKEHLVRGYTVNQKRLEQLRQTIQLVTEGGKKESLQLEEAKGLLSIIDSYINSFVLLNQFDSHTLRTEELDKNVTYEIQYPAARAAINELQKQLRKKKEATDLFGKEKDEGFKSSLQSIVQTLRL